MASKSSEPPAPRKRRTREHVLEDLSQNALERHFFRRGHSVTRPSDDYGVDLVIYTYDEEGFLEPGAIRVQLKASDHPRTLADGSVAISVDTRDYRGWMAELYPVFLVLYDATLDRAHWQYIQAYFAQGGRRPADGAASITVRFPKDGVLCDDAVD